MAKIKVHVWHGVVGDIVAIGRAMGSHKVIPQGGADCSVLELEIQEEQLANLHRTHRVDVERKALVRHS